MSVTIEMPSRESMVKAMGSEPEAWAGNCHGASAVLVRLLGPERATIRRGYFIGKTKPGAFFHERFSQHSWVELRDGRVADPTRFAFVGGPAWPIWVGPDDEYDIGGCRTSAPFGPPPSPFASDGDPIELTLGSVEYVADLVGADPWSYAADDPEADWLMVSREQLMWLANLPVKDKEGPGILARHFAAEVYEAICNAGHSAMIPIDRRDWILPEHSNGRSSF